MEQETEYNFFGTFNMINCLTISSRLRTAVKYRAPTEMPESTLTPAE